MEQEMEMPEAEDMGRATDTVLGHLSLGEIVIPRTMQDDPEIMQALQMMFQAAGIDINEFTVGHEANKINPETGYPEFFKFKKIFRALAPAALSYFAPGLGSAIGGSLLGAGAVGSATLGNAILGAGLGAATGGGLKGAALGALSGGIGANLGSLPTGTIGGGETLPWNQGSGILGSIGKATGVTSNSGLGGALSSITGGTGGGGSTFNNISSVLGGIGQDESLKKQRDILAQANQQQQANLESLRNIDVTKEPGYQFAVQQGQEGLNAALGAQGNLFSGRALQAASDLNQQTANRFYNDAYQRELNRLGMSNQAIGNLGEINANTMGARSNNLTQTLGNILNGGRQYSQEDLINLLMSNRMAG